MWEILLNSVAIFAAAYLLQGVTIKNYGTALVAAIILALINWTIGGLILLLTLPINLLTLGLFTLVINAAYFVLIDKILDGMEIRGFGSAIMLAVLTGLFNLLLSIVF